MSHYECVDCCDTGLIGGDPCDVCQFGNERAAIKAWVSPVQRIINICESGEFNAASDARAALDEIYEIAKAIRGTNEEGV